MTIFEELKEIIVEQMGVNPDGITMDSDIVKDLGCDSLDIIEMLMTIENHYGIEFDNSEAIDIKTVGEVVKHIEAKKN